MLKNIFLVSCAVLVISGLPYYAQDISVFVSKDSATGAEAALPIASRAQTVAANHPRITRRACVRRLFR